MVPALPTHEDIDEELPSAELRFFDEAPPDTHSMSLSATDLSELSMDAPRRKRRGKGFYGAIAAGAAVLLVAVVGYRIYATNPYLGGGEFVRLRSGSPAPAAAAAPAPGEDDSAPVGPPPSAPAPAAVPAAPPVASVFQQPPGKEPPVADDGYEKLLDEARQSWQRGKRAKALAAATQALEQNPSGAGAMSLMAIVHLDSGRMPKALEFAEQALAIDDANAEAHFAAGVALQEMGRGARAKEHYRRYLELEPRGRYASDARSMLQ